MVLDEHSKKLIDNVVKEDDILNQNIASMTPSLEVDWVTHG
jgi:hypothetical protein